MFRLSGHGSHVSPSSYVCRSCLSTSRAQHQGRNFQSTPGSASRTKPRSQEQTKPQTKPQTQPQTKPKTHEERQLTLWDEALRILNELRSNKLESANLSLTDSAAPISTTELASSPSEAKPTGPPSKKEKAGKKSKGKAAPKTTTDAAQALQAKAPGGGDQTQVLLLTDALNLLKTVLNSNAVPAKSPSILEDLKQTKVAKEPSRAQDVNIVKKKGNGPKAQPLARVLRIPPKTGNIHKTAPAAKWPKVQDLKFSVERINAAKLMLEPIDSGLLKVPKLQYGLDRVLFNPGVYHLQDPRSHVYNFDPYLASIMPIQQFDFKALAAYITSSKDETLISMARKHGTKYTGSTSSMTTMLAHFHYLLSSWRPINPAHISRGFVPESFNFTRINRAPAAAFLHYKNGVYAIDADKEFDTANILSMLGRSMEKLLTLPKTNYERYMVSRSHEISEEERNASESYHYTKLGDFMMRSQLDAADPRLPGSGMFDLKTRAVVSIRMEAQNYRKGLGYEIRSRIGQWESFEREYYDMIRAAFLKYSLQVRMGRMDGIFVAFHNTRRIFGFQYISIDEMDLALHGTMTKALGDQEFKLSVHLLNQVLERATAKFPERSVRIHIETRPSDSAAFMYIFAKPVTTKAINEAQDASKASIAAFEEKILGIASVEAEEDDLDDDVDAAAKDDGVWDEPNLGDEAADHDAQSGEVWESLRQRVEETLLNEALGISSLRETIEDALEQSGLLRARSSEESRRYVDALLDVITSGDTETAAHSISRNSFEGDDVEHETVDAEDSGVLQSGVASGNEEDLASPASSTNAVEESDATPLDETEDVASDSAGPEHDESMEPESAPGERQDQHSSPTLDTTEEEDLADNPLVVKQARASLPHDNISLKDLIIKLAESIEATPPADDTAMDERPDVDSPEVAEAPQNKRFERILSQLVATAKTTPVTEICDADSDGSHPTTGEHAEDDKEVEDKEELLGMILTIRNKVDGKYVLRPDDLKNEQSWVVEYAVEELDAEKSRRLYEEMITRRKTALQPSTSRTWDKPFRRAISDLSKKGAKFRQSENDKAKHRPVKVYGLDEDLKWEDTFKHKPKVQPTGPGQS